jgi:hypothetical protein
VTALLVLDLAGLAAALWLDRREQRDHW